MLKLQQLRFLEKDRNVRFDGPGCYHLAQRLLFAALSLALPFADGGNGPYKYRTFTEPLSAACITGTLQSGQYLVVKEQERRAASLTA